VNIESEVMTLHYIRKLFIVA